MQKGQPSHVAESAAATLRILPVADALFALAFPVIIKDCEGVGVARQTVWRTGGQTLTLLQFCMTILAEHEGQLKEPEL